MSSDTHQAGQVDIQNNEATLTFTRFLQHPPKRVWEAVTSPQEFSAWYEGKSVIDPRVGGLFQVFTGDSLHWKGEILSWQPPTLFEYEYNLEPCEAFPSGVETIVRWELEPHNDGTRLTFTQTRLKSNFGFAPAMHVFLERLEAHLKQQPLPDFWQRFQEVAKLYPIWNAQE
ncbi:MAG: SRPBCC domain-containing protein [Deinococcota bacterium]